MPPMTAFSLREQTPAEGSLTERVWVHWLIRNVMMLDTFLAYIVAGVVFLSCGREGGL